MSRELIIEPSGWPCTLKECIPGHLVYQDQLCFKTEYSIDGKLQAFNCAGEYLCIPDSAIVQPVQFEWRDTDE